MSVAPRRRTQRRSPPAGEHGPERRCIVSGRTLPPARLIRFVIGPDERLTPDLGLRLPGRGIWVSADRAAIDKAVAKGLFGRAARQKCIVPPDLADQVGELLRRRALEALGLARKAGELVLGMEKLVTAAAKSGLAALILAHDGAPDSRRKLFGRLRALGLAPGEGDLPLFGSLGSGELSLALGRTNVVHAALKNGRMAEKLVADLMRVEDYERTKSPQHEGRV